jgi:hypothetical protein
VAQELEFVFLRMEPATGLVDPLYVEPFKNHPILIRSFITKTTMEHDMV